YTVTYNGNGHTGGVVPTDSSGYTNGQEVIVVGNTGSLVKLQDGISLNFLGWTNSGGTFYTNNDIFSIGSASVTLYAKWSISVLRLIGPAGGFICYDKGSYSDGWRYLEVAAASTEWTKQWGSYGSIIGGTYTAIGTGQANTTVVVT
ncbi:MAG: hypothetical protein KAR07_04900, partial [Spirochaetes bacterium]|nr:hypothetical protein [Spirochaetota bacterium]